MFAALAIVSGRGKTTLVTLLSIPTIRESLPPDIPELPNREREGISSARSNNEIFYLE